MPGKRKENNRSAKRGNGCEVASRGVFAYNAFSPEEKNPETDYVVVRYSLKEGKGAGTLICPGGME